MGGEMMKTITLKGEEEEGVATSGRHREIQMDREESQGGVKQWAAPKGNHDQSTLISATD